MSNRARALKWTAITTSLLAAASLVITTIHPDFNPVVTTGLIAGAVIAWISHRRAVDREQFDILRRENEERHSEFVTVVEEILNQWSDQVDLQVETVSDLARLLTDRQYAPAVGGTELAGSALPRLTAVK